MTYVKRALVIATAMTVGIATAGYAEDGKILSATEITEMVSGNTLSGVFGEKNTRYAQRNHANGIAVIHVAGSPIRLAPWFVKEPDTYCEDWDKDGVLCYQIVQDASSGERRFVYSDGSSSPVVKVQEGFHPISLE